MISSRLRVRKDKKGKGWYHLEYRLHGGRKTSEALHVTDRQSADRKKEQLLIRLQREAAGVIPQREVRAALDAKLAEHLAEYLRDLNTRGKCDGHGKKIRERVGILIRECGWGYMNDITADSFEKWRNRSGHLSARTLNHYLAAVRSLINWMMDKGYLEKSPLGRVKLVDTRGKQRVRRRAMNDGELGPLFVAAGDRMPIFLFAVRTGLRRHEMELLVWDDLVLEGDIPTVTVRAEVSKNRERAVLPLAAEVVAVMKQVRPADAKPGTPVFGHLPRMEYMKTIWERAGIAYKDELGRVADFHSLRKTFITNLAKAGVPPRHVQALARHKTLAMTMNVYTDENMLDLRGALGRVQSLGLDAVPPLVPHILGPEGHLPAQRGTMPGEKSPLQPVELCAVVRQVAQLGMKNEMVEAGGVEPPAPAIPPSAAAP